MKKNRLHNQRGTTLLECVLALAVFAGVSVMIAMMMSTASLLQRNTTDTDRAVNVAGDAAELEQGGSRDENNKRTLLFVDSAGSTVAQRKIQFVEYSEPVTGPSAIAGREATVWRVEILAEP